MHVEDIFIAYQLLKDVVAHTPLQKNERLSEKYDCNVYMKREDLQHVRSFKLRGAYYKIKTIEKKHVKKESFVQVLEIMRKVLPMHVPI